jgi:hypothetical protein
MLRLLKIRNEIKAGRWPSRLADQAPPVTFHCCVHKTASKWVQSVLSHPKLVERAEWTPVNYRTLMPGHVDPRNLNERIIPDGFPEGSLVTHLYIGYNAFDAIPKPDNYRAFFVQRDPRDITVSWYFSMKHSHPPMGDIARRRHTLQNMNKEEGLRWAIDELEQVGLYGALRSWARNESASEAIRIVRFEDLTGADQVDEVEELFGWLGIPVDRATISSILEDLSFEKKSGREQGQEDRKAHLRKGEHGDWQNHFDEGLSEYFVEQTGNLVSTCGYAWP